MAVLCNKMLAFLLGTVAACPYVWCFIFRSLYMGLVCGVDCWIYAWAILLCHIIILGISCIKYKKTLFPWMELTMYGYLLILIGFFVFQFFSLALSITLPIFFLVNLCMLSIWTPICFNVAYMAGTQYGRCFEVGFFGLFISYYLFIQYGLHNTTAFWIPITLCHIMGPYVVDWFKKTEAFRVCLISKRSIYFFGKKTYTLLPFGSMLKIITTEIILLIFIALIIAMGLPTLQWKTALLQHGQVMYFAWLAGPLLGGPICSKNGVAFLYMTIILVMFVIMIACPLSGVLLERMYLVVLFLLNSTVGCVLERVRLLLIKALNGVKMSFVLLCVYNIYMTLIILTISQ
ncbi:hypothetical protein RHVP.58 [Cricetid gammaherpesvirus 2]|uniref:Envelope protein UL43 n=1 Tax=Cricetid gammaherpesvirus 2 TaxID=1605972 RepID=E9M5P1_9GAMA|nr:hypothetical protein RHVP.58 [Cricetid gammaherpesvirus 2]ADW24399.1 hypothetical protein RHVP.58 [Cricetid gammaherpesvirus 2]ADW24481.1 hypothetical protein RHVP-L.58 [Cricetid gammaherpesvirus 2]